MSIFEYLILEGRSPVYLHLDWKFLFIPGMENDEILLSPRLNITCNVITKNDRFCS